MPTIPSSTLSFEWAPGQSSSIPRPPIANTHSASVLVGQVQPMERPKIAIIDDEPVNVALARKFLQKANYQDFVAIMDANHALSTIQAERPDLILLDIVMPGVSGLELLRQLRGQAETSTVPILILSAATDPDMKIQALELNATDFLSKPIEPSELLPRVRNALYIKAHHDHLARYAERLEEEVRHRTTELALSRREIIECLARAAEYRDEQTGHHILRVGMYAAELARAIGMSPEDAELIEQAAQLHDVGKIGIPDIILRKPAKLDAEEFAFMKRHCAYGQKILQRMSSHEFEAAQQQSGPNGWRVMKARSSSLVELAATIALSHHEWWNGEGYPNGLRGEEIPLCGRITAIADVYDALSSPRPYKPPYEHDTSVSMIENGSGKQFDPNLVDTFLRVASTFNVIRRRYSD